MGNVTHVFWGSQHFVLVWDTSPASLSGGTTGTYGETSSRILPSRGLPIWPTITRKWLHNIAPSTLSFSVEQHYRASLKAGPRCCICGLHASPVVHITEFQCYVPPTRSRLHHPCKEKSSRSGLYSSSPLDSYGTSSSTSQWCSQLHCCLSIMCKGHELGTTC